MVRFQKSFWACFGWNTTPVPYVIYWALDGVALIAVGGILLLGYRSWRCGKAIRMGQVGLLVLLAALFISAWAYYVTVSRTAGYGRYSFPGLPAMALLLSGGLAQYVPWPWRPLPAYVLLAGMLSFSLFCLLGILIPAYARPPLMEPAQIAAIPHRLNLDYGGKARLLACDVQPRVTEPGEKVVVTLYWQALKGMQGAGNGPSYIIYVHLFGQKGEKIGQRDTYPGLGRFPTSLWRPGDVFADAIAVPIHPEARGPALVTVETGLYARKTKERLQAFDSQGRALGHTIVGRVRIPPPEGEAVAIPHPADYTFEDGIALVGYGLECVSEREGRLTLYWEVQD